MSPQEDQLISFLTPTNQEPQRELRRLKAQLMENNERMRRAAVRAQEMIAIQQQYKALKEELERVKRGHRTIPNEERSRKEAYAH
jgi:Ni,Fe-hydrogenase I large subunit